MKAGERCKMQLSNGRNLSWMEYGDARGLPVILTMGTPSSAIGAAAFDGAAKRAGLRLISVDKPGYGQSTRHPRRRMVDYGRDVAQLVSQLGFDQVLLAGQSGGGPHAIAAAAALGDKATRLLLLGTYGPVEEPWMRKGTNSFMRMTGWQSRHAPILLRLTVYIMRPILGSASRLEKFSRMMASTLPPQERAVLDSEEVKHLNRGSEDGYRNPPAVFDEFFALGRPWGFNLEEVKTNTGLWHGTLDTSCRITLARQLAQRMPNATLRELDDYGHMWFDAHLDEAFAWLAEERGSQPRTA